MKIVLGADHRGFKLKEKIKERIAKMGYVATDVGAFAYDKNDDYPRYAQKVARRVARGTKVISHQSSAKGILICGSGIGMAIAANRFRHVRAGLCTDTKITRAGRHDDDINVLVLASDYTPPQKAIKIVGVFLETRFGKEKRYKRRIRETDQ